LSRSREEDSYSSNYYYEYDDEEEESEFSADTGSAGVISNDLAKLSYFSKFQKSSGRLSFNKSVRSRQHAGESPTKISRKSRKSKRKYKSGP